MQRLEGEITTLTSATSKSKSLRSTIPISIVRQFRLKEGDKLQWKFEVLKGKMTVIVQPTDHHDDDGTKQRDKKE